MFLKGFVFLPFLAVSTLATGASPRTVDVGSLRRAFERPVVIPSAPGNPSSSEKIVLGRTLFFDPRLSASGIVSCATCHNPSLSWGDGLRRAVGHGMKELGRRTPSILNVAFGGPYMWDGRFETLEEQALGPISTPAEMNLPLDELVKRLRAVDGYTPLFDAAFPGEAITPHNVARAIATFERTVISPPAPFDRWVGGEPNAISSAAVRGFSLFNGKAKCAVCHSGWRLTDDSFHDLGVRDDDLGRGGVKDFTEITALKHAFKTPTLRDIERRAPYFHGGTSSSLESVVEFYNRGGDARRESLSDEIRPLGLTEPERADLVAFLKTLSSPTDVVVPVLPR